MRNIKFLPVALLATTFSAYAQESLVIIATQTGNSIGLTISGYQYKEPGLDVVINSALVGVDYTGTNAFGNDWFLKGDAPYAYGFAKYTGSGTQSRLFLLGN